LESITAFVGAYVQASSGKSGGELVVEVSHDRYDQQGRFPWIDGHACSHHRRICVHDRWGDARSGD